MRQIVNVRQIGGVDNRTLCGNSRMSYSLSMSDKHSEKNRRMWSKVPKEVRSARMAAIAKKRMESMTLRQKKLLARRLVNARIAKRADAVE